MNNKEIRDKAYEIATGNHLAEALNFQEFQDISEEDLMNILWEPLEYWTYDMVIEHISQIAENINDAFIKR